MFQNHRLMICCGLLLCLMVSAGCDVLANEDTRETVPPITLEYGREYQSAIDGTQPYQFSVPNGSILTFEIEATDGLITYTFLDPNDARIEKDNVSIHQPERLTVIINRNSGGLYKLLIGGFEAAYKLRVLQELQDDGDSGGDAGDSMDASVPLETDRTYSGVLGEFDTVDVYRVEVPANGVLHFRVTNDASSESALDARLLLDENILLEPDPVSSGGRVDFIYSSRDGSEYGLVISSIKAFYNIDLVVELPDDAGFGGDASDIPRESNRIRLDEAYQGVLSEGDKDCYLFSIQSEDRYEVQVENFPRDQDDFSGRIFAEVRDAVDGKLVKSDIARYGNETSMVEELGSGDYYLCIENDSPLARYEFIVQEALGDF